MLVQNVNDWLPIGKQVHKNNPKYPDGCPSCTAQVEVMNHLMKRPATGQGIWQKECFTNIKTVLDETDTAHPIKELLVKGIHAVLNSQPAETIAVLESNPEGMFLQTVGFNARQAPWSSGQSQDQRFHVDG